MKKTKKPSIPITVSTVFLCVCLLLGVYTILRPARDFSVRENRQLASFPKFSISSLVDGSFTKGLSTYFADQFAGRDMWTGVNLNFKRMLGQKENGGVYLGKHGQLYLKPEQPDKAAVNKNIEAMNNFKKAYPDVDSYVCIVPNAVTVQGQNLPGGAPVLNQKAFLANIQKGLKKQTFIDLTQVLEENSDEYIFYKTDHHWTSLGAKLAFEQLSKDMNFENVIEEYTPYTVAKSFTGTLASKSGCYSTKDTVDIYLPKTDLIYEVEYAATNEKAPSVFKTDALKSNDKYTIFFGGNHPRIDIQTSATTGRHLLVFKDSYFNCLSQFIWPYFDTITIIDPRYYYDYAGDIINQESITDMLYLYNADTFGTDKSLYAVLEAAN